MILSISKNKIIYFLLLLLLLSIAFNLYSFKDSPTLESDYPLLNPTLVELGPECFRNDKRYYQTNFYPLKERLNQTLQTYTKATFGLYFENFNTGSWIGIHEKNGFIPASLLKIPLAAAILKRIEEENLTLDMVTTAQASDINVLYGAIGRIKAGDSFTVLYLLNHTLFYSDNTAANMLRNLITSEDFQDTVFGLGIPFRTTKNLTPQKDFLISPKEFSNIFRSLYYSSYLRRRHSQLLLSLLSHTSFDQGLPAGVPPEIPVAHKVGYRLDPKYGEEHHDCGIVYYPYAHYLLCVMTRGLTQQEADRAIQELSKTTYEYINEQMGCECCRKTKKE